MSFSKLFVNWSCRPARFRTMASSSTLEEYAVILEAIQTGNSTVAERTMEVHLIHARSMLGLKGDDDLQ
jgi:DNA-binding FadR family transcriptional regulator